MSSEQEQQKQEPKTEALESVFTNEAAQYWLDSNPVLVEAIAEREGTSKQDAAEHLALLATNEQSHRLSDSEVVKQYLAENVTN